jgi:RNA polymerase sigma-70 factor (ECF subfamily)
MEGMEGGFSHLSSNSSGPTIAGTIQQSRGVNTHPVPPTISLQPCHTPSAKPGTRNSRKQPQKWKNRRTAATTKHNQARPPSAVLQDEFFLAKLKTRDPYAWRKLLNQFYPLAISIATSLLHSHADAEDITQQALIAIAEPETLEKANIQNSAQLRNFLTAIVRNKSKDHLRKKTAQRRGQGNVWNFSEMETDDDTRSNQPYDKATDDNLIADIEDNESLDMIKDTLKSLPEKQQKIIEGFYLRGLTYGEISEMYDIPTGSIGVYLTRAVTKIRSLLNPAINKQTPGCVKNERPLATTPMP